MLLSSFFIVDIDKFDLLPDIELPENAFLCYRITYANRSHIDHFIQKVLLLKGKNAFCIMIDLNNDAFKTDDEFEQTIAPLVSLSFQYKYIKPREDNPLLIFDSSGEDLDKYVAIAGDRFKEQGYNNIETAIINSTTNNDDVTKGKNLYFHLQQNTNGLFNSYHDLMSKIASTSYAVFFFVGYPEILPDVLDTISKVEIQFKKENSQAYHLLEENVALTKKERESQTKAAILEEQLESVKNYQNPSDSRYKKQITELLYFYKYEYEILPLWYKRFGHIIKVLRGQRTFKSLFRDNVKKYKN
jgi:hypothetical protein